MAEDGQRFYREEEAEAILRLASSYVAPEGGISKEKLLDAAAELGISADAVERAELQFTENRTIQSNRKEFDQQNRNDFKRTLFSFVIFSGVLTLINVWTFQGYFWAAWPIFGLGMGVISKAIDTFFRKGRRTEEEFQRWLLRRKFTLDGSPYLIGEVDRTTLQYLDSCKLVGQSPSKIMAIKKVREVTGIDLKLAKDLVETFPERNGFPNWPH